MDKKIIAVALVLVLMVTAFVGCSKKRKTTVINGQEFALVTDDEGNTIVNDDYKVAFYVTDYDGDTLEDDNGEPQTNWIQLYGAVSDDKMVQTDTYKINIPEGWTSDAIGRVLKDGTDKNCYINCSEIAETTDEVTLESYLAVVEEQNQEVIDGLKKEGYNAEFEKGETAVTLKNLLCTTYIFKITDNDGKIIHYAENLYFVKSKKIYKLEYACINGVGYDEEFSFERFVNTNFVFKK